MNKWEYGGFSVHLAEECIENQAIKKVLQKLHQARVENKGAGYSQRVVSLETNAQWQQERSSGRSAGPLTGVPS